MNRNLTTISYQGFRTAGGWEVAVAKPGQPLRLLDLPSRPGELALILLTDYLGDPARAADLQQDFTSLTIDRFTEDWELDRQRHRKRHHGSGNPASPLARGDHPRISYWVGA